MGEWIAKHIVDPFGESLGKPMAEDAAKKTPEQRQADFQTDYKAMTGSFGDQPVGDAVKGCSLAKTKAQRRAERLDKIKNANAKASKMPDGAEKKKILEASNRLKRDVDEVEYAKAAKHVYLKNADQSEMPDELKAIANSAPEGMTVATPEDLAKLGIKQEDLTPDGTNFRAAVYKLDPEVWGNTGEDKYVVAFRGSTPDMEDWRNNARQGQNENSEYYKRAVGIGEKIKDSGNGDDVHLAGHSLGGGLASAASGGGGLKASTFNAAGLHKNTVARYASNPDEKANPENITAMRVEGEAVTKAQEKDLTRLALPKAVGEKVDLEPVDSKMSSTELHAMNNVIFAIEKEKKADEAVLDSALK